MPPRRWPNEGEHTVRDAWVRRHLSLIRSTTETNKNYILYGIDTVCTFEHGTLSIDSSIDYHIMSEQWNTKNPT